MLLVLDGFSLTNALTRDTDGVLTTLIQHCQDQIVYSGNIEKEYVKVTAYSSLRPVLVKLEERKPRKAEKRRPKPVGQIPGLGSQHSAFIEDSAGLEADYFITQNPLWLTGNIQLPKGCKLEIVTPSQYVKKRQQDQ